MRKDSSIFVAGHSGMVGDAIYGELMNNKKIFEHSTSLRDGLKHI